MIELPTYKEVNRELSLKVLKAVKHVMFVMNETYREFWNRDPQKIVDSLNEDVELTQKRFYSNTALGIVLNDSAAAAEITDRVNLTMPEGYEFDSETRTFSYAPPVVIIIEPEVTELDEDVA